MNLPAEIVEAASFGLQWQAGQRGLFLTKADAESLASNALRHALGTGLVVTRADLDAAVAKENARTAQVMSRATGAEVERDRYLCCIQSALADFALSQPEEAARLASAVGVMLPEPEEASK